MTDRGVPGGAALHVGRLAARVVGHGPPVVLLHGLVGSGRYWDATYDTLAAHHQLVIPDLLGFGRSPRPPSGYGPEDHAASIVALLDEVDAKEPAVVVGHSVGSLLALHLAATHATRVRGVIGFGPPIYRDADAARRHLGGMGPMARLFVLPGPLAALACAWVCNHRKLAARLAVLTHPSLPRAVAADSVEHTWASYTGTLTDVLLAGGAYRWLDVARCPVHLVAGDRDPVVDRALLSELGSRLDAVTVDVWPGDHHLPLRSASRCVDLIRSVGC